MNYQLPWPNAGEGTAGEGKRGAGGEKSGLDQGSAASNLECPIVLLSKPQSEKAPMH